MINYNISYSNPHRHFVDFEFTAKNFSTCVYDVLKYVAQIRVNPFQYVLKIINDVIYEIQNAVNMIRTLFDTLRRLYTKIMDYIYNKFNNYVVKTYREH